MSMQRREHLLHLVRRRAWSRRERKHTKATALRAEQLHAPAKQRMHSGGYLGALSMRSEAAISMRNQNEISMQSTCNRHAIGMQSVCNQHAL